MAMLLGRANIDVKLSACVEIMEKEGVGELVLNRSEGVENIS